MLLTEMKTLAMATDPGWMLQGHRCSYRVDTVSRAETEGFLSKKELSENCQSSTHFTGDWRL